MKNHTFNYKNLLFLLKPLINKPLKSFCWVLFISLWSLLFSCTEIEPENPILKTGDINKVKVNHTQYEEKLMDLTLFFGEVLKEPAAREELFSFAKVEGGSGDISYSLKKLFEEGTEPIARKKSAIVASFTHKGDELSRIDNKVNKDELIDFIKENDISILAPYLAEDFDPNEIDELTVSWWTQEFEEENVARDSTWKGATKALKISLDNSLSENINHRIENEYILADDDWAVKNPTIVLGAFNNEDIDLPLASKKTNGDYSAKTASNPVQLCDANDKSNENIIVRMPALRLDGNIRRWPNANEMYFWVATAGEFEIGSNGLPVISPDVNMP